MISRISKDLILLLVMLTLTACYEEPIGYIGITEHEKPLIEVRDLQDTIHMVGDTTIIFNVYDFFGIKKVQIFMNGYEFESLTTPPYVLKLKYADYFRQREKTMKITAITTDNFGNVSNSPSTFIKVETDQLVNRYIKNIFCGDICLYVSDLDNRTFAWGMNKWALGLGDTISWEGIKAPTEIPELQSIKKIVYSNHTYSSSFALLENGTVLGWGSNQFGRLGIGKTQSELASTFNPIQLTSLSDIVDIGYDSYSGIVVNTQGEVFTWGMGANPVYTPAPTKCSALTDVKKVFCFGNNFLVIKNDDNTLIWSTTPNYIKAFLKESDRTNPKADSIYPTRLDKIKDFKVPLLSYYYY